MQLIQDLKTTASNLIELNTLKFAFEAIKFLIRLNLVLRIPEDEKSNLNVMLFIQGFMLSIDFGVLPAHHSAG